jgi:protein arginine kinase
MKAYERISGIDDALASMYDFAFDDKLGFITACPSNLGTGMRASVMMFLPGLARSGELKKMLPDIKAAGMTVRGAFGEGTSSEGFIYQVSNERTMGLSEGEILRKVSKVTMTICDLELREREKILAREKIPLKDSCLRAYGSITNCAVLPLQELTEGIVKVKLGMALGFLSAQDIKGFNNFLANMRPASFRIENELEEASEYECDLARAEIVRKVFPELVRRTD